MIVCITEKPSVARDIARLLGANDRHEGYFQGGNYQITWTYGHLCTLKEPADYTPQWKRWSLGQLPMIPPRFGIKVIPDGYIEKQFRVIESLVKTADEVINCGDAGQEGELIQRWVMQKAGVKCPVKRLWISSLTDESIREGFASLKPEADFNSLYYAGLSRAIGDWVLGMNATRLYSLKYSSAGNVLSVGRVQTPTLALIVNRHREIENFVPEDFWEIKTIYRGATFNSTRGRFSNQDEAKEIVESIKSEPLTITDLTKKQGKEAPPRLFDLTSLQVECNKKWGWTADQTLKLIQSLYEKKVTTYPRVDTTYLSTDIYPKISETLRKMTPYAPLTASLLDKPIIKPKRIFDNAKVTDHHAIIPTGVAPNSLVGDERKLYHLIALRFIAAFYPDCVFLQTTVNAKVANVDFKASGKVIIEQGWRSVYQSQADKAEADKNNETGEGDAEETENILPDFSIGESGPHKPSIVKKTTQPPKLYTEGTLLRAMESAGKTVDDETLREALKENGIGRPSTRSAIIETLFKRRYIKRQRKSIDCTEAGMQLIDTINQEILKSASLTGIWENRLRLIERGQYTAEEFIGQLKLMITEIVKDVLADNSQRQIIVDQQKQSSDKKTRTNTSKETKKSSTKADGEKKRKAPTVKSLDAIICPACGQGHIVKGRTAYGCSRYKDGCKMLLPFDKYAADLTPAQLNRKISKLKQ